jgi:hypothetical protein
MQPAGQDPEDASGARNGHSTALFAYECQSFLDNVIASLGRHGPWNDSRSVLALQSRDFIKPELLIPDAAPQTRFRFRPTRFSTRLLARIAGGIVRVMPLSRPQPMPGWPKWLRPSRYRPAG